MTRTTAREIAIQLGFAASAASKSVDELLEDFFNAEYYESLKAEDALFAEYPDEKQMEYISRLLRLSEEHRSEIDERIERCSKGWKLDRISRTALAILRTAVCEMFYMDDIPLAAAINEAVELDKGYDESSTVAFVNGVLGAIAREEDPTATDLPITEEEPISEEEPPTMGAPSCTSVTGE